MLGQLSPDRLPSEVREHAITTLMRYQNPDEYTDGTHWDNKMVGNLRLGGWQDYRSSLAQRYIASSDRSWKMPHKAPSTVPDDWPNDLPVLRVKELNHILYGSEKKIRGQGHGDKPRIRYMGGHMSGYGWIADRSEFPVVWDKNDIIAAAKHVLETVKPTKNGTYFGEYNGFHLYVSTEMRKGKIRITTITPNVRRRV
jgi:hypothetical protein